MLSRTTGLRPAARSGPKARPRGPTKKRDGGSDAWKGSAVFGAGRAGLQAYPGQSAEVTVLCSIEATAEVTDAVLTDVQGTTPMRTHGGF